MTAKTRRSFTARDWEDIVRIELTDAIESRSKGTENQQELLTSDEWEAFINDVLKSAKSCIEANHLDVCFKFNEKHYSRIHQYIGGTSTWALGENRCKLRIVVELLDAKTRLKIAKKITEWLERNVDAEKGSKGIGRLKEKLANYKDLAARFRLGYTGDPSDLDGIQNKCRAFLLGEGDKK